jgi:hypothetical protein
VSGDSLNPYAPPVAAEPLAAAEAGTLWMVQGNHLLVRDGARLPPVSMLGEDDGGGLTTSHQVFASGSGIAILVAIMPVAIALGVMMIISIFWERVGVLEGVVSFFVSSWLLRRFKKVSRSMANIQCHVSLTALKARARRDRWRGWMMMAALTCFLLNIGGDRFERAYILGDDEREYLWIVWFELPVMLGVFAFFLGGLLWAATERSLKCVRQTGGWLYLSGVPASSLMRLAAISGDSPPVRTRKVYMLYQYRLPLRLMLGPRRNPLLVLVIAIMKVIRSPALVRRNFHWSEARRGVRPDRDLAARIAKLRSEPEFAAWQDLGCNRLDSPPGDLRVLTVRLASPDRRHFCLITLARLSKAGAYVEACQTDFRTWTTNGRCLITADQPPFPGLPGYLDFQRVRGDAGRVWSRHLRRCERATPRAVESDEELGRLLEKEADDHLVLLEAAGIRGPLEEVEMPGDWDEVAHAP